MDVPQILLGRFGKLCQEVLLRGKFFLSFHTVLFLLFFFSMLGIEARSLYILVMPLTIELHPYPLSIYIPSFIK